MDVLTKETEGGPHKAINRREEEKAERSERAEALRFTNGISIDWGKNVGRAMRCK